MSGFIFHYLDSEEYQINKKSYTPIYIQIANSLEKLITDKQFETDKKLPSEELLAKYFKVGRPTINKAYNILIKKSIVYRERRKGIFILKKGVQLPLLQECISLRESLKKAGINFSTKLFEVKIVSPTAYISNKLDLISGTKLICVKKIRYVDNIPFSISKSHLPENYFPGIQNENLETEPLFSIFQKKYSLYIKKSIRYMNIIKALDEDASYLNIPIGDPLLHFEGIIISTENKKIDFYDIKLKGDMISFYTTIYNKIQKED